MNEEDIRRILLAPVTEVRDATNEEAEGFADKPDGCLYVFSVHTGQRFLTHISKTSEEYTVRPMDAALPNLKEVNWKRSSNSFGGVKTTVKCDENTPVLEYNAYVRAFEPALSSEDSVSPFWMYCFKHNPLYKKAFDIRRVQSERFVVAKKTPEPGKVVFQRGRGRE